ncbi:MAG: dTDP-4-dehydrorhamnose reductase [Proteobacteria bacterium]|nr:dTDP-4-dehydrorhamnose reductase [Pseudomonadota bacterium]
MNVLVTGAKGQLGKEIEKLSSGQLWTGERKFFFTDIDELDVTDIASIRSYITQKTIDIIINCAAYTAVNKAETEKEKAKLLNEAVPAYLALVARESNMPLIHISTDFVFDGEKKHPYVETDKPNPLSVYGRTKLEGEYEVIKHGGTFIIIRTSWLYSEFGNNFVKTILRLAKEKKELGVVSDQIGAPTYAEDLASVILGIIPNIQNGTREIFHYSNEGVISWYDFAKAIVDIKNINCKIIPIETKDYLTSAVRPLYSVLDKTKIKETFDVQIPEWRDSLKRCLNRL